MRLTVANAEISNTFETKELYFNSNSYLTPNNLVIAGSVVTVNSSGVSVGANVTVNSTVISAPQIIVGTGTLSGGLYTSVIDYQEFTSNGTWYNPLANSILNSTLTGREEVLIMLWGSGGSGATSNGGGFGSLTYCGSGGGGCVILTNVSLSEIDNTAAVTIFPPGNNTVRQGNTVFTVNAIANYSVTAYGGVCGNGVFPVGGGWFANTTLYDYTATTDGYYQGSKGASSTVPTTSLFGGGHGALGNTSLTTATAGHSIYGGAGAAAGISTSVVGNTVLGGIGGNSTSLAGGFPGGGGSANSTVSGAGGNGYVRIWVLGGKYGS